MLRTSVRIILALLLGGTMNGTAQSTNDTVWYNAAWKACGRDTASYFRAGTVFRNGLYYVTDRYRGGQIQMTGTFIKINPEVREGLFLFYDSTGHVHEKDFYVQGKLQGELTFYFTGTKTLKTRYNYKDGKLEGIAHFYDSLGYLKENVHFKQGKPDGEAWIYFAGTNKIKRHARYSMGELDGTAIYFDSITNNIRAQINWKQGKATGTSKWYTATGKLVRTVVFKPGRPLGEKTYYDTTGMVISQGGVDDNLDDQGLWKSHFPHSDILQVELHLTDNVPDGSFKRYDYTCNNVLTSGYYKQGKRDGTWRFYNGCDTNLVREVFFRNGLAEGMCRIYDPVSKMVTREGMDSLGMEQGLWKYYFRGTRQLSMIRHYVNGRMDGELITYFPNGTIRRKEVYKDGTMMQWNCYSATGADTIYYKRYQEPEYPVDFQNYFGRQIEYPEAALTNQLEGKVKVRIHVDASGRIYDSETVSSTNRIFNREAERVALTLPIFAPAKDDGEPIETDLILPVVFSLNNARIPSGDF